MNTSTLDCVSQAPDLLKRFVPTAFEGVFAMNEFSVLVRSNERAIIELLAPMPVQRQGPQSFIWNVIYDIEAPSEIQSLTLLRCGRTAVANLGPGCLVAVDYDRCELIAFVGLRESNPIFRETVLRFLTALTLKVVDASSVEHYNRADNFTAIGDSHE